MKDTKDRIAGIMTDLLSDYGGGKTIDEIKTFDIPDKKVITEIIEDLRAMILPGYFKDRTHHAYTLENKTSMLLEDVVFKLKKHISIVLRYDSAYKDADEKELRSAAEDRTFMFLEKLPKIREYIEADVQAAYDGDPAAYNRDEIIYSYPGLFAIMVYRIAHELFRLGVPVIPRIMTEYAHSETGIDIHPGAVIGRYFFIDHGTGIVIGETTEIGDNVKIYQGVTLGALSTRGGQSLRNKKRHPTIEDNVTIYSNASILGGETVIGKNAVIGGNAFITRSVPANAKVSIRSKGYDASNPAQSVDPDDESWYYII